MDTFAIPRVFFEKYINELSSDAFKVLLKMLYLAKTSSNDVNIRSNRVLRRIVGMNTAYADSVWNELIKYELVIKKERRRRCTYILNSKKIKLDNNEFESDMRNLQVTIFKSKEESAVDSLEASTDEAISKKIKRTFTNVSNSLFDELVKTAQLVRKHNVDREKRFTSIDLGHLLAELVKYDSSVLEEICYRYNNNPKIAGMRGIRYVARMAQGVELDLKNQGKIKHQKNITNEHSKEETEKRKNEGERRFAIKVATGNVKDNIMYKNLLKQDVNILVDIWKKGVAILKDENRESEINDKYEWLQSQPF